MALRKKLIECAGYVELNLPLDSQNIVKIIKTIMISNQIVIEIGGDSRPNNCFIINNNIKQVIRTQNLKDKFC